LTKIRSIHMITFKHTNTHMSCVKSGDMIPTQQFLSPARACNFGEHSPWELSPEYNGESSLVGTYAVRNASLRFINKPADKVENGESACVCAFFSRQQFLSIHLRGCIATRLDHARFFPHVSRWTRRKLLPLIVPYLARLPSRACNKSTLRRTPL